MSEKLLVVHVAAIGDAAVASTVIERLRAEHPGAEITWVCGEAARPIVALYDGIARIITVDQSRLFHGGIVGRAVEILGLWRKLIGSGFSRAFVLHPDPRYRLLVLPLFSTIKLFLTRTQHGRMIPVPARFLGDEYARLVGGTEHVGPIPRRYEMADLRPKFSASPPRATRRVLLVPGGAKNIMREDALRRWPAEHYGELAKGLLAEDCEVTLIGSAHDVWVRPAFDGLNVVDRIGSTSLVDTLQLMAESDLVISHDTGPMHLARLVRTPLVALFGPTIPAQVLSIDDSVTVLWGGADLACRPCFDGREFARCSNNICLSGVTPTAVLEAARERLGMVAAYNFRPTTK